MIEYVKNGEQLLAIIVRNRYEQKGLKFFTSEKAGQQIGCVGHPKGLSVDAHVHNMVKREVFYTSETLIIKKGKVRADIYDNNKKYIESKILEPGDVILFTDGGHGFKFLEDCQMVEIKQGPYADKYDKVRFKGIE
ncbi:MAG: hypothetical protein WC234_04605, partial [Endomicrobiaceae bacterium]